MSFTVQDYDDWLSQPGNSRCLLAIITCHSPTNQEETLYFSSLSFQTTPQDSLPNIGFDPRLTGSPYLARSIPFFEKGRGEDDFGSLEIVNGDGKWDYLQHYQFNGRAILLLLGDPQWPFDYFQVKPLLHGVIAERPKFTSETIEISVRDKMGILDVPVQTNLLTTGAKKGEPAPLAFGYVRNIEPICVDENAHRYKWHDGRVSYLEQVCDKGVVLSTSNYVADNTNGEFTLTSRPAGTITVTGWGAMLNGSLLLTVADVVKHLATKVLTTAEINLSSFTALNSNKPYTIGLYIASRENLLDILDMLLATVSGYYFFDFAGQLTVGAIKEPATATPISVFAESEIADDGFAVEPLGEVQWRTRLKYQRNYTLQKDGELAGSITDPNYPNPERVEWLRNEWRTAGYETPDIVPEKNGTKLYHLVKDPDSEETLIDGESNAITEAQARQSILKISRQLIKFQAFAMPYGLAPGDIVQVFDQRYQLNVGKNIQILRIRYLPLEFQAEIEGWC